MERYIFADVNQQQYQYGLYLENTIEVSFYF